ncbi:hypothetical protein JCM10213_000068 [Rhodosporidiobolus nylandii]
MAGESRMELIAWLNDLLALNYSKVEQCGSGAAYCQIVDTIFGDVPMGRVKMNAKQEYEFLANFRILQNTLKSHGIDKPIPVDRLVRCKMQDNLEFLQWLKKYWDLNFPGGEYDPVARRGASASASVSGSTSSARAPSRSSAAASTSSAGAARRPPAASASARAPPARAGAGVSRSLGARSSSAAGGVDPAALEAVTRELGEMKLSVEGLEKERDFYFNKLRDIEIIIGARLESPSVADDPENGVSDLERDTLLQMQGILYSTEEGFEVPDEAGEEELVNEEEETF